jgi:predicted transcriptional regulator
MPRQTKRPKAGRRKTGKISVTVRLSPETKTMVDRATEQFGLDSFSVYIEEAIRQRLKRDKIQLS